MIAKDSVWIGHNENLNSTERVNAFHNETQSEHPNVRQNTKQIIKANEEFQVNSAEQVNTIHNVYLGIAVTALSFIFCYKFLSKNIRK